MMKKLNKEDRPLLTEVPKLRKLSGTELKEAMAKGMKLIDTRNKAVFAEGFIPGSINIQGNNSFATWCGWFLDYQEPFILLADESQLDDLTRKLMRIGLDNIYGYVPSVDAWTETGGTLEKAKVLSLDEFKDMKNHNGIQVVDLRGAAEYHSGHIQGADHVFVGTMLKNLAKISKDRPVVIHCQGGDRSSIGYSLLVKEGLHNIMNYPGGVNEWVNNGNPVVA
jgi:hydroxyacylglutathione hydrolase